MNTIVRAALLLAIPVTLLSARAVQDDDVSILVSRLTARAERSLEADALDGLVVVVSVGDQVLLQRGWGRLPGGALADAARPVRAASLVDPLAVIAALQLVDEGKVDLDAPIGTYIEGLEWDGATVTVRHLLTQTSGLIGWAGAFEAKGDVDADVASLVALVKEQGLQTAPGDCFEYSETNPLLIGALVEAVTGKPLSDVITERILQKSNVETSGFGLDDAPPAQDEAACSLEIVGEQISVDHPAHLFREDEFCVSALDLVRIRRALSTGKLTGDAMIETMVKPGRLNDGKELGFGYGFSLGTLGSFDSVTTGGSADGTTVHLADPDPPFTSTTKTSKARPRANQAQRLSGSDRRPTSGTRLEAWAASRTRMRDGVPGSIHPSSLSGLLTPPSSSNVSEISTLGGALVGARETLPPRVPSPSSTVRAPPLEAPEAPPDLGRTRWSARRFWRPVAPRSPLKK